MYRSGIKAIKRKKPLAPKRRGVNKWWQKKKKSRVRDDDDTRSR